MSSVTTRSSGDPWVSAFRRRPGATVRLFCFPYAGGGAPIFRRWPDMLPSNIEVCPVHLPGRGSRMAEQLYTRLPELVDAAATALAPYLDLPFAFFGHSMGALIGFELAQVFRKAHGLVSSHLFVSGRRAPHLPEPDPPTYNLPETQFVEELRRLNGTPKEVLVHPELMELLIPVLRADFQMCQTYQFQLRPPLSCPISVFGGDGDLEAGRQQLEGWREHTTGAFSLRIFPGDHFFLHANEPGLVGAIGEALATVSGSYRVPTR